MTKTIIDSIALFGTYCTCLTNVHRSNRYEAAIEFKRLVCVARSKDHKQKAFQTDEMEIKQEGAVVGAPSHIPTLKFLTP